MDSQRTRVKLQNGSTRYRHVLASEECAPDGMRSDFLRFELIRLLVDTPDLAACGPVFFNRLLIRHDGSKWVAEMEATVKEESNAQQQHQSQEHTG